MRVKRPTVLDLEICATGGLVGDLTGSRIASPPDRRRLKIFFDGGCRPNPGKIEAAVVVRGVVHYFDDLGAGTSSDSEWLALGLALRLGQSLGERDFDLMGDCANVIAQANGESRCRTEAAAGHRARFWELASSSPPRRVRWIPRNQNLAGIALARRRSAPGGGSVPST